MNIAEPGASITWAREIKNINKQILTPTVLDSILKKINDKKITSSKDPVAKEKFLSPESTIESVLPSVAQPQTKKKGLVGDIEQLSEALQQYSWTALAALRGDSQVLKKLEETEKLIKELKKALSQ